MLPNVTRNFSLALAKGASIGQQCIVLSLLLFVLSANCLRATALEPGLGAPFDLPIAGMLLGVPAGAQMHVKRSALLALPCTALDVTGEFGNTAHAARGIFLQDLIDSLPIAPGADLLTATCSDGYMSVYPFAFIKKYRPFIVVEIEGLGPDKWPPPGLPFNPGPLVIDVSNTVVPGVESLRDIAHKRPWGVVSIRVTSMAESFGGLFKGRWADASEAVSAGREIWIHSCASCHPGPEGVTGGVKSGRPFPIVEAYAGSDRKFFMQYVRDPKSLVPSATMEPHPKYSDKELGQLIAFLTEKSSFR
jgi:hypothetical protein